MFSKKDNGKLKINWESLAAFVFILCLLISSIVGFKLVEAQSDLTKDKVETIIENTTKNTEGTLKSDVVGHKELLAVHNEQISVLKATQEEIKKIQSETKQAIVDLNKKMDSNQRDVMRVLLDIRDNK